MTNESHAESADFIPGQRETPIKVQQNVEREIGKPPVYDFPLKGIARLIAMIESGLIKKGIEEIPPGWPTASSDKERAIGVIGELAFQGLLYYYEIASVRNISYHREEADRRPYDFETPIGTVEVKTASHEPFKRQLQINKMRWSKSKSEIVASMKLDNDSGDRVSLMGWIYGSDVEKLPTRFEGKDEAYYIDHDQLPNDGDSLLEALQKNINVQREKWGLSNISGNQVSP